MTDDGDETYGEFKKVVNMTVSTLEKHLQSAESRSVGQKKDGGAATGHVEGRRIVQILQKKQFDLSDEDFNHMRKVVGNVHRHLKQGGPKEKNEVESSPWRLR